MALHNPLLTEYTLLMSKLKMSLTDIESLSYPEMLEMVHFLVYTEASDNGD